MSNFTRVYFPGLGIDFDLPSVAFTIGSYDIHFYGIIIAFGFMLAVLYGGRMAYKWRMSLDGMTDVLIWGTIFGIVCARAYYVIFEWGYYSAHPAEIVQIWNGGLAIYGGIIGALIGAAIGCKVGKIDFRNLLDLGALGLLIGQGIGRWGNFFNQEAFGTNTTLPWGMTSDTISAYLSRHQAALAAQGIMVDPTLPVHPTFLYESLWNLIGVAILLLWLFPRRSYDGQITLGYTAWYGLGRFFVEGLRTDSLMWGSVRVSQALGGVLFIVAAGLMLFIFLRGRKPMTLEYIEGQKKPRFTLGRYVDTKESRERIAALDAKLAEKKNGKKPTQPEQKEEPHEREDH